jgi:transcription initiation factor TFIIH subunit 3
MADDEGDCIVLLLDILLFYDQVTVQGKRDIPPDSLLEQILYFIGAYRLLNNNNRLAVFALNNQECQPLYIQSGDESSLDTNSNPYRNVKEGVESILRAEVSKIDAGAEQQDPCTALACGLSRALCLINRITTVTSYGHARSKPRIVCIIGSPDVPLQYIPVMNAIFSAQRAEVVVDALVLHSKDSAFLQQAAHLTGGLYIRPTDRCTALQYLVHCLSADTETRKMLVVHQPLGVDFRASCFCHKKTIDIGYVCSVCLSIFCEKVSSCKICGTEFHTDKTH